MMPITRFFDQILGTRLNTKFSWGSVHPRTGDIYLRVWREDIKVEDGKERVQVLLPRDRHNFTNRPVTLINYQEREEHIRAIQRGCTAYCVVCIGRDYNQMLAYDHSKLLVGRKIIEDADGVLWLEISERTLL